jgi:hypothetical protein
MRKDPGRRGGAPGEGVRLVTKGGYSAVGLGLTVYSTTVHSRSINV